LRSQLAETALKLATRETELEAKSAQLADAIGLAKRLKREVETEKKSRATLQTSLDRARGQAEEVRRKADQLNEESRRIRSSVAWRIDQFLAAFAGLVTSILSRFRARLARLDGSSAKAARMVAASALFDRKWYLAQYPDVASKGLDPALHYVSHGAAEGRDPGPRFNTRWYLKTHKDVAAAGLNPLLHYLLHGETEGREIAESSASAEKVKPARQSEPAVAAAEVLSFPVPPPADVSWTRQKDITRKEGHVVLELGGLALASVPTADARSDEGWASVAGFARVIAAYCSLVGMDARKSLVGYAANEQIDIASRLDATGDATTGELPIADIWYVNDRDLRVRFGGEHCRVVRFFQYDIPSASIAMVGESLLMGRGADFADFALTNAYMPVLVTVTTPEAELTGIYLLPFPSLCRGGVHYGELCVAMRDAGYQEALQQMSAALLRETLDRLSPPSIARLDVDLQDAIGAEKIFSTDMREWLAHVMQLRVSPVDASAVAHPAARAYLEGNLAAFYSEDIAKRIESRERGGQFLLTLSADSVPSLHALTARMPRASIAGRRIGGSYLTSDSATGMPRWRVRLPEIDEDVLALQPLAVGIGFPLLTALSGYSDGESGSEHPDLPLAIRFREGGTRHLASLVMPIAREVPAPLLRSAPGDKIGESGISVLLAPAGAKDVIAALLESLKLQTLSAWLEVIVAQETGRDEDRHVNESALERLFPGRYLLVEQDTASSRLERLNRAAKHASGRFLLVVGADVALHDPRTLETLHAMADSEKVASAACVLLHSEGNKKAQSAHFRSGGLFPCALPGTNDLVLSTFDCLDVFPRATYPVAGNSAALFMVRKDVWQSAGGFDPQHETRRAEADYATRTANKGLRHLCTSAVAAEIYEGVPASSASQLVIAEPGGMRYTSIVEAIVG
jgi:hypothetical protein